VTAGPARAPVQAAERARLSLPASPLTDDERILHALDRLGYGPRPADLAAVKAIGLASYLEEQLHPARRPAPELGQALASYPVLGATTAQLLRDYPQPSA
jgi:hypothetical protein